MNLADVALEALYVLGVLMCCALLSREEGSREGLGSRRARLFMLALAVEAMQAGLGSLCFASMFVRQVRQCFSAVWADGFPRCRHRFPVM